MKRKIKKYLEELANFSCFIQLDQDTSSVAQERVLNYEAAVERAFYRCYALLERRKSRVWRKDTPPMQAVFHIG